MLNQMLPSGKSVQINTARKLDNGDYVNEAGNVLDKTPRTLTDGLFAIMPARPTKEDSDEVKLAYREYMGWQSSMLKASVC
jgi:hypothetical protein